MDIQPAHDKIIQEALLQVFVIYDVGSGFLNEIKNTNVEFKANARLIEE